MSDETPTPVGPMVSEPPGPPGPASAARPDTALTAPPAVAAPPLRLAFAELGLGLAGLAALGLGMIEVALYFVLATLLLAAHAADVHPALRRVHAWLGWIPAVVGAVLLGAVAFSTTRGVALAGDVPRLAIAGFALLGAGVTLALLSRRLADACARGLFRGATPDRTLRLAATLVVTTLWLGPSLWFVAHDVLAEFLADPSRLTSPVSLTGSLVGYVVLAFAGVGWLARRDLAAALDRLGLVRPRARDLLAAVVGVLVLWLFNAGSEWLERATLPELWRRDSAFGIALAGTLGPAQVLLLGLSAGVGEEITLRGALQPKLGIVLTAVLFAVLHVQYSWYGILSLMFFGLLLGLVRRHGNTTAAILVHAVYDVIAVATAGH